MNFQQKLATWIGVFFFLLVGIFPPWNVVVETENNTYARITGHGFIFSPPNNADTVNYTLLQIQWFMIAVITSAVVYTLKDLEPGTKSQRTIVKSQPNAADETKTDITTKAPEKKTRIHEQPPAVKKKLETPHEKKKRFKDRFGRVIVVRDSLTDRLARLGSWLTPKRFYLLVFILLLIILLSLTGVSSKFRSFILDDIFKSHRDLKIMVEDVHLLNSLYGHNDIIRAIDFDPTSELIVSASYDNTLNLWNVLKDDPLYSQVGHAERLRTISFSPSGKYIASGSDDYTIKLWDAASGGEIRTLEGHTDKVRFVSFSPNSRWIVSAGADETVKLWDVDGGYELKSLTGHYGEVWAAKVSPDGLTIASAGGDRTVRLWDVRSGVELRVWKDLPGKVLTLDFAPNGRHLAFATGEQDKSGWTNGYIEILDLQADRDADYEPVSIKDRGSVFTSIDFHPSGKILVAGSTDKSARIFSVETGKEVLSLKDHLNLVSCVCFSPDGSLMATSSGDKQATQGEIRIWGPFR